MVLWLGGTVHLAWVAWRSEQALGWPTAPARIVASSLGAVRVYHGREFFSTRIADGYKVAGTAYIGRRIDFDAAWRSRGNAERVVAQYAPGMSVRVYVDPEDPTVVVPEPGALPRTRERMWTDLCVYGFVSIVFLGLILRDRKNLRVRATSQAGTSATNAR